MIQQTQDEELKLNTDPNLLFWKKRYVHDNVHQFLEFPEYYWQFIDTPQFQRLRDIRQLGSAYLVFPGAVHTRFSHALGIGHLTDQIITSVFDESKIRLKHNMNSTASNSQNDQSQESLEQDKRNVILAGLMSQLGQGMYSNFFQNHIIPFLKEQHGLIWDIKAQNQKIFEYLIDDNHIDIHQDDFDTVSKILLHDGIQNNKCLSQDKAWMYQIVNNNHTFLDATNLDQLKRDSISLNLKCDNFDSERIIKHARLMDNGQLSFDIKLKHDLRKVYECKYQLSKDVYTHRVCTSLDYMHRDVLISANQVFKFHEMIQEPEQFMKLTDPLFNYIEIHGNLQLREAQEIMRRIRQRDLYRLVGQILVDDQRMIKEFNAQNLVNFQEVGLFDQEIFQEDIIIDVQTLKLGDGITDPLKLINFHQQQDLIGDDIHDGRSRICYPSIFQEHYIRVFVKDEEKFDAVKHAFHRLCQQFRDKIGAQLTPDRQRQYSSQKRYSSNQASRANSQRVSSASNMDSGTSPKGRDFIGKYSQDVSAWVEQLEDLCTPQKKRIRYD
eukprot:403370996